MSRIGNKVITIPAGVEVTQNDDVVTVKGPKGELNFSKSPAITMTVADNEISFDRPDDSKSHRTIHGTTRAIVNNMVVGVTEGFEKNFRFDWGWIPCSITR